MWDGGSASWKFGTGKVMGGVRARLGWLPNANNSLLCMPAVYPSSIIMAFILHSDEARTRASTHARLLDPPHCAAIIAALVDVTRNEANAMETFPLSHTHVSITQRHACQTRAHSRRFVSTRNITFATDDDSTKHYHEEQRGNCGESQQPGSRQQIWCSEQAFKHRAHAQRTPCKSARVACARHKQRIGDVSSAAGDQARN